MLDLVTRKNSAFTLIEILMIVVVIGIVATIFSPWLLRRKPSEKWPAVLDRFNNCIYFAKQEAITTNKNYRILFRSNNNEPDFIVVQEEKDDPEKPDQKIYKDVFSEYFQTKYILPDTIKMVAVYKGRKEQFAENKNNAHCYVIPNGLVQDVMIYLVHKMDGREMRATFKIEPFVGKFKFYEGYLKGER